MRRRFSIAGILFLGLAVQVCFADFPGFIGFEQAEQYEVGLLNGQNGWTVGSEHTGSTQIIFDDYNGARLQMTATGNCDGSFHLAAASPQFYPGGSNPVSATQEITIDRYGEADFIMQTVDMVKKQPAVSLQFTSMGRLIVNNQLSTYTWMPQQKMTVDIQHNISADTATVTINSELVAYALDISNVTQVHQLQYGLDDAMIANAANVYLDNLVIIPEPASGLFFLVILAAVMTTGRNRL